MRKSVQAAGNSPAYSKHLMNVRHSMRLSGCLIPGTVGDAGAHA